MYTITRLNQVNNRSFSITWSDGLEQVFVLAELQRVCPCASCAEGMSPKVDDAASCRLIKTVGQYGIRIYYTSGCSSGIYSFEFLRGLNQGVLR